MTSRDTQDNRKIPAVFRGRLMQRQERMLDDKEDMAQGGNKHGKNFRNVTDSGNVQKIRSLRLGKQRLALNLSVRKHTVRLQRI